MWRALDALLKIDPNQRVTAEQLMQFPIFAKAMVDIKCAAAASPPPSSSSSVASASSSGYPDLSSLATELDSKQPLSNLRIVKYFPYFNELKLNRTMNWYARYLWKRIQTDEQKLAVYDVPTYLLLAVISIAYEQFQYRFPWERLDPTIRTRVDKLSRSIRAHFHYDLWGNFNDLPVIRAMHGFT
jgi:hypothetical protein